MRRYRSYFTKNKTKIVTKLNKQVYTTNPIEKHPLKLTNNKRKKNLTTVRYVIDFIRM